MSLQETNSTESSKSAHETLQSKANILIRKIKEQGIQHYIKAKKLAEELSSSSSEHEYFIQVITDFLNI